MRRKERAYTLKICYNDRPRNQVIWIDVIQQQESNGDHELGGYYISGLAPVEITYDQKGEFFGHKFKDRLIEN